MAFIHINPFREFEKLTKDIDHMARNVFSPENRPRITMGGFNPRIDILDAEKAIIFEAEIPGIAKEDIKVSVNDENILTIRGEKKFDNDEKVKTCCRNERAFGQFERSFKLPELADPEKISAEYENGLLILTIDKMEPVRPKEKSIEIK